MIKFDTFLKENKVSYYKLCQLGGFDASSNTRSTQEKAQGVRLMSMDEFTLYCNGLSKYLNKKVTIAMFEYGVEKIKMK